MRRSFTAPRRLRPGGRPGLQFPVSLGALREFIPAVLLAVRDAGQHPDGPAVGLLRLDHLRAFPAPQPRQRLNILVIQPTAQAHIMF